MVIQVLMKKGNQEELDEEQDLVRDLHTYCQVNITQQVPVEQTTDLFGRKRQKTEDHPVQIPLSAIARYFPGSLEPPYHLIDRALYMGQKKFALFTFNPEVLVADVFPSEATEELKGASRDLDQFDYAKYYNVYSFASGQSEKIGEAEALAEKPMVWLELLCVDSNERRKGEGRKFLEEILREFIPKHFPEAEEIIVGIDVPGTRDRYVNKRLKEFYEKIGFTFQRVPGSGSLIGFLAVSKE